MSQIILRGKSPCVGRSPTVMMYFLWPRGPCQFYPAQLAQSSSPNSLGLLRLRRLRRGCAPQGNRRAYTCLRPHTQVPRLPLALGSKACSLPRGLWPATQAEETPTRFLSLSVQWLPGSEGRQDTEQGQPGHCWGCSSAQRGSHGTARALRSWAADTGQSGQGALRMLREQRGHFLAVGRLSPWLK